MTSVDSPLALNPQGPTVLLGYERNLRMFAGFDLHRHRSFTVGSPSVQIDVRTVRQALQDGFAYDRKGNDELAIGIRPDHLLFYCQHSAQLHAAGSDAAALTLLHRASRLEDIPAGDLAVLPRERERIVGEVSRLARAANFRTQVLHAYGQRCAVTRAQLRLIEAAHILPVAAGPESVDVIGNGIALSPTYHAAFDRGLIYLDENLEMRLNAEQARNLRAIDQDGGLAVFEASLGRIHLPPDRHQWPTVHFIRQANGYRNIG
ncbi:MAG: HNH endonuclease [Dehalococcoidia bacterium]|nr:HNH endonuclease [Dehalococcoidia bacterium]